MLHSIFIALATHAFILIAGASELRAQQGECPRNASVLRLAAHGDPIDLWNCLVELTEEGGDPDITNAEGNTPLHLAAASASDPRNILTLKYFGGYSSTLLNDAGEFPLDLALTQNPNSAVVATMVVLNQLTSSFVFPSCRTPRDDRVALVWSNDIADGVHWPDWPCRTIFPPPDVGADCTAFLTAEFIAQSSPRALRYCQVNANLTSRDKDGNSALHLAMMQGEDRVTVHALLVDMPEEHRQDYLDAQNNEGWTALHLAARHATDPAVITWLVNWGADPDSLAFPQERLLGRTPVQGTTPLHRAVRHDDPELAYEITARLLAAGADPTIQRADEDGDGGQVPLHLAARDAKIDNIVWLLMEAEIVQSSLLDTLVGREIKNHQDSKGRTPLYYLVGTSNSYEAIELLLLYGLDPDMGDETGITPLMLYAQRGEDPDILDLLFDFSENPCRTSEEGFTALAYARENENLLKAEGYSSGEQVSPVDRLRDRCN